MTIQPKHQPILVRLAYLMPLLCGVIFIFLAWIPHLFYQANGDVYSTLSLFELLNNTYKEGSKFLTGTASGTTGEFYFYLVMLALWTVSFLCIILYGLFAVFTAAMTFVVWTPHAIPTVRVNNLKRAYRIAVPNRGFFVFYQTLPLFPAFYPYFLQLCSQRILGQTMKAYYYGIPDWITVTVLTALSVTLFFVTLSAQKNNKMDLFRIYKIENNRSN